LVQKKWKSYLIAIGANILVMSIIFILIISVLPVINSKTTIEETKIIVDDNISLPFWTVSVSNIDYYLYEQVNAGYRIPGTQDIEKVRSFIKKEASPFPVVFQNFTYHGVNVSNLIVRITPPNINNYQQIILGAHYDTRAQATSEPSTRPVPGANDGASGVAGLLSIINWLKQETRWKMLNTSLVFVFFDAEDQGGLNNWEWIVGSTYYASNMNQTEIERTKAFILLDMIGDIYLNLKQERFSTIYLNQEFWIIARLLGFSQFFTNQDGYWLIDDHRPFLDIGIPSIDLIDFDYSEWHKTTDDLSHVSSASIAIVSDVVLYWLSLKANFTNYLITMESNMQTLASVNYTLSSQGASLRIFDSELLFCKKYSKG